MGKDLAESFPAAREVFAEADEALGFSLSRLCFEGPPEQLQLTENTQPAILATSIACFRAMQAEGIPRPDFVAGHSLGEYSALVAAGALSLSDAVRIVRLRGQYMQTAVPVGVGAMAAVMGLALSEIERVCTEASETQVCAPANINSVNQVVIAGDTAAVDRAIELLKGAGARRVVKLNVSAPFHCALMMPAQEKLEVALADVVFQDLSVPLIANASAKVVQAGSEAREALIKQVSSPVRWLESIELLIEKGVTAFVEVGPGKVLSGLVRQINREVKCTNVEDAPSLGAAGAALAGS
jgi:[acyl-carrier-protein] S-malonyltransferase